MTTRSSTRPTRTGRPKDGRSPARTTATRERTITFEPDEPDEPDAADTGSEAEHDAELVRTLTGGFVSLRHLRAALRRRRRLWITAALVGLLGGVAYRVVVPVQYEATATVYLAHPASADSTVAVHNDLAILSTRAVGRKAIALLGPGGHGLTPATLLGKSPGTVESGNVLQITVSGPNSQAAVRRVNAVTSAFLSLRAQLYRQQAQALATASNTAITKLQGEIATLTNRIDHSSTLPASQVALLQGQQGSATTQVSQLEQSIQQNTLDTLSVISGTHVITRGSALPISPRRTFLLDALSGLAVGLAAGIGFVVVQSSLSSRLRRREDVAAVLGAPVGVSVGRLRRRWPPAVRRRGLPAVREGPLRILVQYLEDQLDARGAHGSLLIVAMDDQQGPAAALRALAGRLGAAGERVVLVDDTTDRSISRSLGSHGSLLQPIAVPGSQPTTLLVPPKPWEAGHDERWRDAAEELGTADAVLVIASVDPAIGAWHLRRWASDAVVTVTTGRSTPQGLAAVTELLDAAGVTVSSAALLGTDAEDESAGLGLPDPTAFERRLGLVRPVGLPT